MLLTITTTHRPANDLGYLLHKHPERFQSFDLSFGKVHVYYSEVGAERCTACLLLDVDSVGLVRGKNPDQSFLLAQYVNDRPYAAWTRRATGGACFHRRCSQKYCSGASRTMSSSAVVNRCVIACTASDLPMYSSG